MLRFKKGEIIFLEKLLRSQNNKTTMEPFKNFKNFILTSTSTAGAFKDDDNIKTDSRNMRANIENLQPISTSSVNDQRKNISDIPNSNKLNETNLSARISNKDTFSNKTTNNKKQNKKFNSILKKDSLENTSGMLLFKLLDANLEQLIAHFKANLVSMDNSHLDYQSLRTNPDQFFIVSPQFVDTFDTSSNTYFKLSTYAKELLNKCVIHYTELDKNAALFDISADIKSNGYRSLLSAFESCCKRMLSVVNQLNDTKSSFLFQLKLNTTLPGAINIKDFQTWVRLMEKIEIVLQVACEIQKKQLDGFDRTKLDQDAPSLFFDMAQGDDSSSLIETNLLCLGSVYQESFFGRTCGFQFCESLRTPLTGASVALASYNDGYELYSQPNSASNSAATSPIRNNQTDQVDSNNSNQGAFVQQATLFKSLVSGTKYIMDPELRAKKISKVMKDANVEFCKAFWQLTETDIVQMGSNMVTPNVVVNTTKKIPLSSSLRLPKRVSSNSSTTDSNELITIDPPKTSNSNDTVQIRLLSHELRDGMQNLDDSKSNESSALFNNILSFNSTTTTNLPKSPYLLFHVHGGGFIAHSSKSHEIYLRPWCKELKIPIVSVDYSLAPEHVFPRASEECFYVYAWCLLNKDLLGWTGEKIICIGDSAGGSLVTNVVQRAIKNQIRIPDALIPIYTPFLSTYSISPSRLMSIMDPLLNLGILWRCLAAYSGIDFKKETERFKTMLNLPDNSNQSAKPALRSSPTMASLIKTTPFKAFLTRSTSALGNKSPPASPTSPKDQSENFNIRYSKRESFVFDSKTSNAPIATEELVNIEMNSPSQHTIKEIEDLTTKVVKTQEILTAKQKERLLQLHKVLGDSVFLIERLRNHPLGRNIYMSPVLTDDELLSQFPKTYLITTDQDPLLDDSIQFYRLLKSQNVECRLDVLEGLHHGFLCFIKNSKDCLNASKFVTNTIKTVIGTD